MVILITLVTIPATDCFSSVFAELTELVAVLAVELAEVVVEAVDAALLVSLTVLFAEPAALFAELAALSLALLPQPTVTFSDSFSFFSSRICNSYTLKGLSLIVLPGAISEYITF